MRKFLGLSLGFILVMGSIAMPTSLPDVRATTFPSTFNFSVTEVDLDTNQNHSTMVIPSGDLSTQGSPDVATKGTSGTTSMDENHTEIPEKKAGPKETTIRGNSKRRRGEGSGEGRVKELKENTGNQKGHDQNRAINTEHRKKNSRNFSSEEEDKERSKTEEEKHDDSKEPEKRIQNDKRKRADDSHREIQDFDGKSKVPGPPNLQAWVQVRAPVLPELINPIQKVEELREVLPRIRRQNKKGWYECPDDEIEAKNLKKKKKRFG